ncbi:MAG: SDR family oxidoreductase [Rhodobacteraceae bacterium]|nr:SDR family oxidoreductase [Paracoccaceae bacterium]
MISARTRAVKDIGLAIAELFAEEGANVILTAGCKDLLDDKAAEIKAKGSTAMGLVADSSDPEALARVFEEAIKVYGQVENGAFL